MPRSAPQVAHFEDYDSDANSVKPGTKKEARRKYLVLSKPPKALDRYRSSTRDGASDSGYSSHTSGAQASHVFGPRQTAPSVQAPQRPATSQGTMESKPILHRSESQRSKDKHTDTRRSTSQQRAPCSNPNCQHTHCRSVRGVERPQTVIPQTTPQNSSQQAATVPQYQSQPAPYPYQYTQAPAAQAVPMLAAQPRPRQPSTSRPARPQSFHGYSFPGLYAGSQGPPPSASAYQNLQYAAWVQAYQQQQQQQQQQQAYQQQAYQNANAYNQAVANPGMFAYPQRSPVTPSPTSPNFTSTTNPPLTYSARANISGLESAAQQRSAALNRNVSTRPAPARVSTMPGSYPRDDAAVSSESESSASDYSVEAQERNARSRARDSRLMSSSSERRPSCTKQYATAPAVPTRSSRHHARDILRRSLATDSGLEYISSSDNVDSDRTARAVVDRPRTSYTNSSRSSRRPSIATTTSSGRTKATTLSSSSGPANITVEQRSGRRVTYLSQKDREALEYSRQQLEKRRLEDDVRAYQEGVRGPQPPELTADNIREHEERRRSQSYYSSHSRRPSRSSSRAPEAMKIESGGAVIHVYPGSTVEMRPGKDGASTLVIGSPSGKHKTYYSGSRSSSDRRGSRQYTESDGASKREEAIPEDAVLDA